MHTLFGELVEALISWHPAINDKRRDLLLHRFDLRLSLSNAGLDTVIDWLAYHRNPGYAKAFESKFKDLYANVDRFYEKLADGRLNGEQERNEQIQLLEDGVVRLAEYIANVEHLCLTDKTIRERIIGSDRQAQSKPATTIEPELLTTLELSQLLHISTRSVFRLKSAGQLPPSIKINKATRWRASDIRQWIEDKKKKGK